MDANWPKTIPKIPVVPEEERTPLVVTLLEICSLQKEIVQALKDEIARLKGQKPRPRIKPSTLEKGSDKNEAEGKATGKRPGSAKRRKTRELTIHETVVVPPENIPEGSRFKGYQDFTVQDIVFREHNILYRLERWMAPSGDYVVGKLPSEVAEGHFGPTLVSFILSQHYHGHVTQPLILEQLRELNVDISAGQVNRILTENKDRFYEEKDSILAAGLDVSRYVHVDDTSARHQGRNGFCTHIGNELFAWFESTESKSRINFLTLLRGKHSDYVLNSDALEYMRQNKLPKAQQEQLATYDKKILSDEAQWKATLESLTITTERHVRIATEGALLGSVLEHGLDPGLAIISDDAGQFNVLLHGLCWIHAERTINKLVGFTTENREALAKVRSQIWDFYAELKAYKEVSSEEKKVELEARFDELFTAKTCFVSLNLALKRLYKNKSELLLVLDRPDIPLHNNLSEGDIREYVKKRKISGSTRSECGRRCRDTFTSLKKTCRKLGVPFWRYLNDRISRKCEIPPLSELIRQQSLAPET
jgi:hypothetical protein